MKSLYWLILIFVGLNLLVLLVYALVVKAYYWGGKKESGKNDE